MHNHVIRTPDEASLSQATLKRSALRGRPTACGRDTVIIDEQARLAPRQQRQIIEQLVGLRKLEAHQVRAGEEIPDGARLAHFINDLAMSANTG